MRYITMTAAVLLGVMVLSGCESTSSHANKQLNPQCNAVREEKIHMHRGVTPRIERTMTSHCQCDL